MRILYDSQREYFKKPFGALSENQECILRIDIPKNCKTVSVLLDISREDGFRLTAPFTKDFEYDSYESYKLKFSLFEKGLYFYHFDIKTEREEFKLYKSDNETNMEAGENWQLTCFGQDFYIPESFCGRVMYQIFPDRFNKLGECNTENKLKPFSLHKDKNELPVYLPNENGIYANNDFFGGNLNGITQKLSYLCDLGVGIIYLNPIFFAYSNHRYDTADYKRIDDLLGTEEDLRVLCESAHEKGMKVILDGVFSHTGDNSIYFDKYAIFENGAFHNPKSPYRDWYTFQDYPKKYTSWWGIDTLPCVNELNESYLDYVIFSEDSVISHWLSIGVDGFRLDVADELPDEFIAMLKRRMREIKKDSFLIGEVWEDASNKISYGKRRKYFLGDELDTVMNYPFRSAIIDFAKGKISSKEFSRAVMTIAENYPLGSLSCAMNSLSTHDTVRILNALSDVPVPQNKNLRAHFALSGEDLKSARRLEKACAFLQFTLPGNPCIYYGDEIGMQGYEDPLNRAYFKWNSIDTELFEFYKNLSKIKNTCKAVALGNIEFISLSERGLSFLRKYGNQEVTVEISLDGKAVNTENAIFYFSEENISFSICHKK